MKKSEMIEKICDILHTYRRSTEAVNSLELSEWILNICEREGMSPPDHDGTVFCYNEGNISPPKWEPEDESN